MSTIRKTFNMPQKEMLLDDRGFISKTWFWFLDSIQKIVLSMGQEETFELVNNQSSAADITGLKFNKSGVTMAVFEYLVQRVTTGGSAVELTEVGILIFVYNPTSETWSKVTVSEENPDDAGITITITSSGQVQYATTNEGGTASISRIWYRARTLSGKNNQYSTLNR